MFGSKLKKHQKLVKRAALTMLAEDERVYRNQVARFSMEYREAEVAPLGLLKTRLISSAFPAMAFASRWMSERSDACEEMLRRAAREWSAAPLVESGVISLSEANNLGETFFREQLTLIENELLEGPSSFGSEGVTVEDLDNLPNEIPSKLGIDRERLRERLSHPTPERMTTGFRGLLKSVTEAFIDSVGEEAFTGADWHPAGKVLANTEPDAAIRFRLMFKQGLVARFRMLTTLLDQMGGSSFLEFHPSEVRKEETLATRPNRCPACGLVNPPESNRCDCGAALIGPSGPIAESGDQAEPEKGVSDLTESWQCSECGNYNPPDARECVRCGKPQVVVSVSEEVVGRSAFTPREWECLKFAPLWVFSVVAQADGKVDDKESATLSAIVQRSQLVEETLLRELLGEIARDVDGTMRRYFADERSVEQGLEEVKALLDTKLPSGQSKEFKRHLFFIGHAVADASGGGLFGTRDRVSDEEKRVLSIVAVLLGLTPEDLAGE